MVEVQEYRPHPLFSPAELEDIRTSAAGLHKGRIVIKGEPFWEAVGAAGILRHFRKHNIEAFDVSTVTDPKSGKVTQATLLYEGKPVYPSIIEGDEEIKSIKEAINPEHTKILRKNVDVHYYARLDREKALQRR